MSSSSSISATTVNGTTRITGLSSGLDVDSIVEQLVTAEKAKKLNKLQQKLQLAEWRQEAYRDIIADVQDFCSTYFDVTSSSSLLSSKSFNQYSVTSSSSAVAVSYTSAASAGNHTIAVSQLATAATLASSADISPQTEGDAAPDYSNLSGKSFVITVDDTERTVSLDGVTDLASLQDAVDSAVGEGKLVVNLSDDGYLTITAATDSGVQEIVISDPPDSGDSGLSGLGFGSSAVLSNRWDTSTVTLEDLADLLGLEFNIDGQVDLTINATTVSLDKSMTLDEMMDEINDADCGATMEYDTLSGQLVLMADDTGAGQTLVVTEGEGSNFLEVFLTDTTQGLDAKITLDGKTLTRSSNTITVDGVTYTLNATTGEAAAVSLTLDVDGIYDLISSFVEDYNTLISTINAALDEDYDSDYPPLTDDQKAEMSDEEIENWETKAKTGLLENDSILEGFLDDLRSALTDSMSGQSLTIFDIGIDTGTYDEQGTLYIDEDALKEAIQSNAEGVMNLFTQQSSSYSGTTKVRSLTSSELQTRYEEEGIAYRFNDILAKNVSTIRDNSGNKGLLLEKAGIENDASNTDNTLSDLIDQYTEELEGEEDRIDEYEENLYEKYSTLETYINQMNIQLSALSSFLSDSSS
jgi:flagellar hook-associated protein 2